MTECITAIASSSCEILSQKENHRFWDKGFDWEEDFCQKFLSMEISLTFFDFELCLNFAQVFSKYKLQKTNLLWSYCP